MAELLSLLEPSMLNGYALNRDFQPEVMETHVIAAMETQATQLADDEDDAVVIPVKKMEIEKDESEMADNEDADEDQMSSGNEQDEEEEVMGENLIENEDDNNKEERNGEFDEEELYIKLIKDNEQTDQSNQMSMDEINALVKKKKKQSKKEKLAMYSQSQMAVRQATRNSLSVLGRTVPNKEVNLQQAPELMNLCKKIKERKQSMVTKSQLRNTILTPQTLDTSISSDAKIEPQTPAEGGSLLQIIPENDEDDLEIVDSENNQIPMLNNDSTEIKENQSTAVNSNSDTPIVIPKSNISKSTSLYNCGLKSLGSIPSSKPNAREELRRRLSMQAKTSVLNFRPEINSLSNNSSDATNSAACSVADEVKKLVTQDESDDHERMLQLAASVAVVEDQCDEVVSSSQDLRNDSIDELEGETEQNVTEIYSKKKKLKLVKLAAAYIADEAEENDDAEVDDDVNELSGDVQKMDSKSDDEKPESDEDSDEYSDELSDVVDEVPTFQDKSHPDYDPIRSFLMQGPVYANKNYYADEEPAENSKPAEKLNAHDVMKAALSNMKKQSDNLGNLLTEAPTGKMAAKRFIDMEAGEEDELGQLVKTKDDDEGENLDENDTQLVAEDDPELDIKGRSKQARLFAKKMELDDENAEALLKSKFIDQDAVAMYKAKLNQGQWNGHTSSMRSQSLILSTDISGAVVPVSSKSNRYRGRGTPGAIDRYDDAEMEGDEDFEGLTGWEQYVRRQATNFNKISRAVSAESLNTAVDQDQTLDDEDSIENNEELRLKQLRVKMKYTKTNVASSRQSSENYDWDEYEEIEQNTDIAKPAAPTSSVVTLLPSLSRSNMTIPILKRKGSLHAPAVNSSGFSTLDSKLLTRSVSSGPATMPVSGTTLLSSNTAVTGSKDFSLFNRGLSEDKAPLARVSMLNRFSSDASNSLLPAPSNFSSISNAPCSNSLSSKIPSKKFVFTNRENTSHSRDVSEVTTNKTKIVPPKPKVIEKENSISIFSRLGINKKSLN